MLSEVPEGWQVKSLKNVAKVVTGKTPSTKKSEFWNGDIPFITPSDLTGSLYVSDSARKLTKQGAEKSKLIPENSLIFTCIASIGKASISKVECVTNQQINACIFTSTEDTLFYHYQLQHRLPELLSSAGKTAVAIINKGKFELFEVLIPSKEERKRIAEVLSSVDESIQATQRLIEQAERVKQGLMEELLTSGLGSEAIERGEVPEGWKAAKFIDLMTLKRGYDLPVAQRVAGSVPVVASNGQIGWHNEPKIDGPVIVTGRSGTIGKVELYWQNCHPLNTTLYSQKINGNDPLYLKYFLQYFKLERFSTGTGVPTLNRNYVHEQDIVIPTKEQQRLIAAQIAAMDDAISTNQQKIERQRNLKKGLMDDLLTGKVRTV